MADATIRQGIGLDIDGVLFEDRGLDFLAFIARQKNLATCLEVYLQTNCWDAALAGLPSSVGDLYDEFRRSDYYPLTKAVSGAAKTLDRLQTQYHLHVVTSRPSLGREYTLRELSCHLPGITFTSHHFDGWNNKARLLQHCGAQLLIEDNAKLAVQAAEVVPVILFPQPGNCFHRTLPQLIHPPVVKEISIERMEAAEWETIWEVAWQQIGNIVQELLS